MTARESSTAKGNARFFAVEAGAGALFCVEEIEWTIVDVSDAMAEVEIVVVLRERWENKWHWSLRLQVKHERKDADKITKTTT